LGVIVPRQLGDEILVSLLRFGQAGGYCPFGLGRKVIVQRVRLALVEATERGRLNVFNHTWHRPFLGSMLGQPGHADDDQGQGAKSNQQPQNSTYKAFS
jgi:hypothetical protein